jgi:ankyrin repeat protein
VTRLGEELLAAAEAGDVDRARSLIQQGASLRSQGFAGRNALTLAACEGYTAIVQLILDAAAELGAEEESAVVNQMSRGGPKPLSNARPPAVMTPWCLLSSKAAPASVRPPAAPSTERL